MVTREQKTGANFFKMTFIAKVGGLELDLFENVQWESEMETPAPRKETVADWLSLAGWIGFQSITRLCTV